MFKPLVSNIRHQHRGINLISKYTVSLSKKGTTDQTCGLTEDARILKYVSTATKCNVTSGILYKQTFANMYSVIPRIQVLSTQRGPSNRTFGQTV